MTNSPDLSEDFLQSVEKLEGIEDGAEMIRSSLGTITNSKQDARSIQKLLDLVRHIEKMEKEQGTSKWFEYPVSINDLPKHRAFFDAGKLYSERLFMAANR